MKGAMSVKQTALACSGPPLSSNVAQRVHRASRIRIHANEPATAWADPPDNLVYNTTVLTGIERGAFRLVDQKWYARGPSNFVNVWIWCSVHAMFSSRPQGKRTTRDCRKGEGDPSEQLYSGSVLIAPIGGTFARRSLRRTIFETSFSTFSRDLSRCLKFVSILCPQATVSSKISEWACFSPHSPYIEYGKFSAMGKLVRAFVSNL